VQEGAGVSYDAGSGAKVYEGAWVKNLKDGFGIKYWPNGNKNYEGQWKQDRFNGKGILYDKISGLKKISGEFVDGVLHGQGKEYEKGIVKFVGGFLDEIRQGFGVEYSVDSRAPTEGVKIFEGFWKKGQKNGKGIAYTENGGQKIYKGGFRENHYEGKGTLYTTIFSDSRALQNPKIYEGSFSKSDRNGNGRSYYPEIGSGQTEYEGHWSNGKPDGAGVKYFKNGVKEYEGYWKDGVRHNQGVKFYPTGKFPINFFRFQREKRCDQV
jgi:antitoxin component YwqK of YwqJK toxin-antitoxin module